MMGDYFEVHGLNEAAGINLNDEKILYCREDTLNLLNQLNRIESGSGMRISGPPGVGKSIVTWYWVCDQVKLFNKTVLWICVRPGIGDHVVRLTRNETFKIESLLTPDDFVNVMDDIVILDGVTSSTCEFIRYEKSIFDFRTNRNRSAISVTSMSIIRNPLDDRINKISSFQVSPWTFSEYVKAIENDEFYSSVHNFLTGSTITNVSSIGSTINDCKRVKLDTCQQAVEQKYYYAGSSAYWMFERTIPEIINEVDDYFSGIPNESVLLDNCSGNDSIDQCMRYLTYKPDRLKYYRFFTSPYVLVKALFESDAPALFQKAYRAVRIMEKMESYNGWLIETDFVHQLRRAKGKCLRALGQQHYTIHLFINDYISFDSTIEETLLQTENNMLLQKSRIVWFVPKKWKQNELDLYNFVTDSDGDATLEFVHVETSNGAKEYHVNFEMLKTIAKVLEAHSNSKIKAIQIMIVFPNDRIDWRYSLIYNNERRSDDDDTFDLEQGIEWKNTKITFVKFTKTSIPS